MQEHPELSVGQRASVRSFIDASIEEAFKNVPAAVTKMNDAVKAITDHLSPTGFRYLLVDVGRPFTGSVSSSSLPLRIRLEAFVRTHFIVEAGGGNYCECNMGSANQCLAKQLCGYDSNCTLLTSGCGPAPFYIMTCDGKCSSRQDGEN
jgi:hypothetical protein